jgi:hypothetical protein
VSFTEAMALRILLWLASFWTPIVSLLWASSLSFLLPSKMLVLLHSKNQTSSEPKDELNRIADRVKDYLVASTVIYGVLLALS